jgi:hypothetical protein
MIRPAKKPTTWAEIDAALARAEVTGAERAIRMAFSRGFPWAQIDSIAREHFEDALGVLRTEAEAYEREAHRD